MSIFGFSSQQSPAERPRDLADELVWAAQSGTLGQDEKGIRYLLLEAASEIRRLRAKR